MEQSNFADIVRTEIRLEMTRQNLSGSALARKMGWGQTSLSKRLRGVVPITTDDLDKIAAALDVPVAQLGAPFESRAGRP